MPNHEEEKPHLWFNLLSVNEHFEGERNNKRAFLVNLIEMMGFLGIGNNPMVGATVAIAVDISAALSK